MQKKKPVSLSKTKIINCQVRYTQHESDDFETIINRVHNWFMFESQGLIDDLPHLGAVIEFWELVTGVYDTDTADDAMDIIKAGDESPAYWNEFVLKYGLNWVKFKTQIVNNVKVVESY